MPPSEPNPGPAVPTNPPPAPARSGPPSPAGPPPASSAHGPRPHLGPRSGEPDGAGSEPDPAAPPRPPSLADFPARGPNALAEMWQRGLGLLLDSLLCVVPVSVALVVAIGPETLATQATESLEYPLWITASFVALLAIYQIVALALTGQTLAMWVLGIRCARYADGRKPTPSQAAIRSLLPAAAAAAPFPLSVAQYVIYFSALFDPLRRAWHDQAGGTIIVRTR